MLMKFVAREGGLAHRVPVRVTHKEGPRLRLECKGILPYPGYWRFERIERGQIVELETPDGKTLRARFTSGSGRRIHVTILDH